MRLTPLTLLIVRFGYDLVEAGPGPSPSLVPPSTFGEPSSTSSLSSFSSITISSQPPASASNSSSATPTNSAQFPSLSGVSGCVSNCLHVAVSPNCSSVIEVNCYCHSASFVQQIVNCTSSLCPEELNSSESLAQQFCNLASQPSSLSFPSPTITRESSVTPLPPTSSASTSSSTGITTTPASVSSSNAASSRFTRSLQFELSQAFLVIVSAILSASLGAFMIF